MTCFFFDQICPEAFPLSFFLPFHIRYILFRNDDDDNDLSPKNFLRHHQHALQPIRRRFSKRYSDIVRPASNKIYLPRRDSIKPNKYPSSTYKQSRTSFKRNNTEGLYVINASEKKTGEIFSSLSKKKRTEHSTRRYQSKNKQLPTANTVDLLAHRMQAAMSVELMHSLDRNFVFGEKKSSSINRSQSFHIPTQTSSDQWEKSHYYHVIPRVNESLEQDFKSLSSEEPTPDYDDDDDDLVIRVMKNDEIGEEPTIDYDVSESSPMYPPDETSPTMYDLGISSSFIAPLTSITPNSEMDTHDQSPFPPTPPPLPDSFSEQTKITFRCRTIAESITPNHRLILKDQTEMKTKSIEDKSAFSLATDSSKKPPSKSSQLYLSKELLEKTTLRKVSHPVSRSYSTYGSISQFNDHPTDSSTFCPKTSIIDEQAFDGLSSSATTSIVIENESEHRTSSKIYNDYKRRASLTSVPIHHSLHSQSAIIHPMHTHIGLRSSTSSSSTTDKTSEMILSNKQMNVCVINQLNQHLTTRFRQQQREEEEEIIPKKTPQIIEEEKVNLYDEPQHISTCKTISTQLTELEISSIPPPPPPYVLEISLYFSRIAMIDHLIKSLRNCMIALRCI